MASVLVVDDDPAMRDSLDEVLRDEGHSVLLAENGLQALELLRAEQKVCLMLLDVMMPVMTGIELLQKKRVEEAIARIPVILMSAFQIDQLPREGVTSIFSKPFDTGALLKEVQRICP
ncbi:MAG TPA: response regulator [Myxococcales bacterium]|nr:response regulator [Myxococcales bacterium]